MAGLNNMTTLVNNHRLVLLFFLALLICFVRSDSATATLTKNATSTSSSSSIVSTGPTSISAIEALALALQSPSAHAPAPSPAPTINNTISYTAATANTTNGTNTTTHPCNICGIRRFIMSGDTIIPTEILESLLTLSSYNDTNNTTNKQDTNASYTNNNVTCTQFEQRSKMNEFTVDQCIRIRTESFIPQLCQCTVLSSVGDGDGIDGGGVNVSTDSTEIPPALPPQEQEEEEQQPEQQQQKQQKRGRMFVRHFYVAASATGSEEEGSRNDNGIMSDEIVSWYREIVELFVRDVFQNNNNTSVTTGSTNNDPKTESTSVKYYNITVINQTLVSFDFIPDDSNEQRRRLRRFQEMQQLQQESTKPYRLRHSLVGREQEKKMQRSRILQSSSDDYTAATDATPVTTITLPLLLYPLDVVIEIVETTTSNTTLGNDVDVKENNDTSSSEIFTNQLIQTLQPYQSLLVRALRSSNFSHNIFHTTTTKNKSTGTTSNRTLEKDFSLYFQYIQEIAFGADVGSLPSKPVLTQPPASPPSPQEDDDEDDGGSTGVTSGGKSPSTTASATDEKDLTTWDTIVLVLLGAVLVAITLYCLLRNQSRIKKYSTATPTCSDANGNKEGTVNDPENYMVSDDDNVLMITPTTTATAESDGSPNNNPNTPVRTNVTPATNSDDDSDNDKGDDGDYSTLDEDNVYIRAIMTPMNFNPNSTDNDEKSNNGINMNNHNDIISHYNDTDISIDCDEDTPTVVVIDGNDNGYTATIIATTASASQQTHDLDKVKNNDEEEVDEYENVSDTGRNVVDAVDDSNDERTDDEYILDGSSVEVNDEKEDEDDEEDVVENEEDVVKAFLETHGNKDTSPAEVVTETHFLSTPTRADEGEDVAAQPHSLSGMVTDIVTLSNNVLESDDDDDAFADDEGDDGYDIDTAMEPLYAIKACNMTPQATAAGSTTREGAAELDNRSGVITTGQQSAGEDTMGDTISCSVYTSSTKDSAAAHSSSNNDIDKGDDDDDNKNEVFAFKREDSGNRKVPMMDAKVYSSSSQTLTPLKPVSASDDIQQDDNSTSIGVEQDKAMIRVSTALFSSESEDASAYSESGPAGFSDNDDSNDDSGPYQVTTRSTTSNDVTESIVVYDESNSVSSATNMNVITILNVIYDVDDSTGNAFTDTRSSPIEDKEQSEVDFMTNTSNDGIVRDYPHEILPTVAVDDDENKWIVVSNDVNEDSRINGTVGAADAHSMQESCEIPTSSDTTYNETDDCIRPDSPAKEDDSYDVVPRTLQDEFEDYDDIDNVPIVTNRVGLASLITGSRFSLTNAVKKKIAMVRGDNDTKLQTSVPLRSSITSSVNYYSSEDGGANDTDTTTNAASDTSGSGFIPGRNVVRLVEKTIEAPAGKLGIVVDTIDGPEVIQIFNTSPLKRKIRVGDRIMYINDIDTSCMSVHEIAQTMIQTADEPRTITIITPEK